MEIYFFVMHRILLHYNLYMNEFLGKYQMKSQFTAIDINDSKLVTCENNSIYIYNFDKN